MSLAAYIWAADLPLDVCGYTAFRVLLKYADRADGTGATAWRSTQGLADELGCSTRTIQRARRELLEAGLLRLGDQRHVQHIREDKRPTVYDVMTPALRFQDAIHSGASSMSPRGDSGVTAGVASGVTAGVV